MKNQELLTGVIGASFLFHDINNGHPIIPRPSSTTMLVTDMDLKTSPITNKQEPLSKEEELSFTRLNDIWGDDEDEEYENLYRHHENLKAHAL